MKSALIFLCFCVGLRLGYGILTEGSSNVNKEETSSPATDKMEKKIDLFAQPSYEHSHYHSLPGGDYGFGYHQEHHHLGTNDDAVKGLLIPLAGVALLGAAALFASNPVLLQLGVLTGKRRRRDVQEVFESEKFRDIQALEKFIDQLPKAQVLKQEKRLLASYLQCSGVSEYDNRCIERLSCEIESPSANVTQLERQVLNIVTSDIMKNEYISTQLKQRIEKSKMIGAKGGKCSKYFCSEIDN